MRLIKVGWLLVAALLLSTGWAGAQSTTGTIRGHVSDSQGLNLPGVVVSVTSASLQGTRVAITSENGDCILSLLPSGIYTVTFEISGFERVQRVISVAPTQNVPLSVVLGPSTITEEILVVGRAADVMTNMAQVATNFTQDFISGLANTRDLSSTLLLAPSVHPTGPGGAYSISGAMSFENLFLVNGVTVNENIRGQAENLYIEDAIQETTIAAAGVSAEYGRFGGGVVNVVTKSGGNTFAGLYRDTLNNDNWRALVPKQAGDTFADDTKLDDVVPTHEYTLGGPVLKDHLWFFTAGRFQEQKSNRTLTVTNIPYVFTNASKRFEGKATYSVNSNHRFQGAYSNIVTDQLNNITGNAMDENSFEDRHVPEALFTLNYVGIITPRFFIESRYSARDLTLEGSGSKFTDRIRGTLLMDPAGRRYWSPTFCAVCPAEQRDNQDIFVKATYFLPTRRGSHGMSMGYDGFNDKREAQNHQSGSDIQILNAPAILRGTTLYPQFLSNTLIRWRPIFVESQGTNFRTHSLFYNDTWNISSRLTANLGVRWDKNSGVDSAGRLVAKNSSISPRIGIVWDPKGDQKWSVTGSIAKYVSGMVNTIADSTSPGGNPDLYPFAYGGPPINADPNGPLLSTDAALTQLFAWFDANNGTNRPISGTPIVRGVTSAVQGSLNSPYNWEYAGGINRQFGARAAVRADVLFRDFNDFYAIRTDTTTGLVTDTRPFAPPAVIGRQYDLAVVENTSLLERRYAGLTTQATYRFSPRIDVGATYTLSRAWGNVDGENFSSGPAISDILRYPRYKRESWYYPSGDLSIDQRHRARLWLNYGVPKLQGLTLSLMQAIESGVPYGAVGVGGVDARDYVTNPGYLTPPDGNQTQYYFTDRDAFRTEGQRRTDFATNYTYRIPGRQGVELFAQLQILNLFNQFQLCGCGASTFANGGNVQTQFIDTTVRTAVTTPASYQKFNPFTTQPVDGVNWAKGPSFGHATNRFAYTTPRTMRISFGVRF